MPGTRLRRSASMRSAPRSTSTSTLFAGMDLFGQLIDPLRRDGSIRVAATVTRLPENDFFSHTYDYRDVKVILLEGIFLLKRELRSRYDLALWIDCSFDEALERAITRNQEGLPEAELI